MKPLTGYELVSNVLDHPEGGLDALLKLAGGGECEWLELKAAMYSRKEDREGRENDVDAFWHVAKAVIALANTRGGIVVVGVQDRTKEAVPLESADPNGVIMKEGMEAYRRKEIQERIDPKNGTWATGLAGIWKLVDCRLPHGQVQVRSLMYCGHDIAGILVKPIPAGSECLRVWKETKGERSEHLLRRNPSQHGEIESVTFSLDMQKYDRNRQPAGEDLAKKWSDFKTIVARQRNPKPPSPIVVLGALVAVLISVVITVYFASFDPPGRAPGPGGTANGAGPTGPDGGARPADGDATDGASDLLDAMPIDEPDPDATDDLAEDTPDGDGQPGESGAAKQPIPDPRCDPANWFFAVKGPGMRSATDDPNAVDHVLAEFLTPPIADVRLIIADSFVGKRQFVRCLRDATRSEGLSTDLWEIHTEGTSPASFLDEYCTPNRLGTGSTDDRGADAESSSMPPCLAILTEFDAWSGAERTRVLGELRRNRPVAGRAIVLVGRPSIVDQVRRGIGVSPTLQLDPLGCEAWWAHRETTTHCSAPALAAYLGSMRVPAVASPPADGNYCPAWRTDRLTSLMQIACSRDQRTWNFWSDILGSYYQDILRVHEGRDALEYVLDSVDAEGHLLPVSSTELTQQPGAPATADLSPLTVRERLGDDFILVGPAQTSRRASPQVLAFFAVERIRRQPSRGSGEPADCEPIRHFLSKHGDDDAGRQALLAFWFDAVEPSWPGRCRREFLDGLCRIPGMNASTVAAEMRTADARIPPLESPPNGPCVDALAPLFEENSTPPESPDVGSARGLCQEVADRCDFPDWSVPLCQLAAETATVRWFLEQVLRRGACESAKPYFP